MHVDWFTVGAQWVNFLILMWLLHRFLYQPIVQAMDRRQQTIEAHMAEAGEKIRQAEQQSLDYLDKLGELDTQRAELLVKAREAADRERERLITLAREESQAMSQQWQREFEHEKNELQQQLHLTLGRLITATARKALLELTSQELEQALFANFLDRLQRLPTPEKRLLSETTNGSLLLASSFELGEVLRSRFIEALHSSLSADLSVRFEPLPDSGLGLMLTSPSYTLEWRLEHYFDDLLTELNTALTMTRQHNTATHVE